MSDWQFQICSLAIQELAETMDICCVEQNRNLFAFSTQTWHETKLVLVNKGTVCNVPRASKAFPNTQQFRESLRFPVFLPGRSGQNFVTDVPEPKALQSYRSKGRRDALSPKLGTRPRSAVRPTPRHVLRTDAALGSSAVNSFLREDGGKQPTLASLSADMPRTCRESSGGNSGTGDKYLGELELAVGYGQAFW